MVRTTVGPGGPVRHMGHLVLHRLPRDVLQTRTENSGREADATAAVSDRECTQRPGHSAGHPILHLGGQLLRPGRALHDPIDHGPEKGPLLPGPLAAKGRRRKLRRFAEFSLRLLGQPAKHLSALRDSLQRGSHMPPGGLARPHHGPGQIQGPSPPCESSQGGQTMHVGARHHPGHRRKADTTGVVDLEDPRLYGRWKSHGSWKAVEEVECGPVGSAGSPEPGRVTRSNTVASVKRLCELPGPDHPSPGSGRIYFLI